MTDSHCVVIPSRQMFAILCPLLIFLTVAPAKVHAAPSAAEIAAYYYP